MGEIWLASASGIGGFRKKIVIKTIVSQYAHDPSFVDMLTSEACLCATFNHPNLIEVFDFFEHDGVHAIAMEYVVGRSLSQLMHRARATHRPIPPWAALRILWECCCGLECAHTRDVIHGDLSPGNVMLSFAGLAKVLDFGVASAADVRSSQLKGKYHYMAPERIDQKINDRRTDVYALGVIMYVLFTGRLPITAPSDAALLWAIVNSRPELPSAYCTIARDVEDVILRAMERDPEARFQDMGSLLQAIAGCRDSQSRSQLDMAMFVGSLFPNAPDLPAHVRATLKTLPPDMEASSAGLDTELEDIEVSLVFDDPIPMPPRQAVPLFEAQASRLSVAGLFDARPAGIDRSDVPRSGVFDVASGDEPMLPSTARGAFGDLPPKNTAWPWTRSLIKP